MRYSAVATDPMDFTRALRLAIGFEAEMAEFEPIVAFAAADLEGDKMLEFMSLAAGSQTPYLVMRLSIPFRMDRPADMMIVESIGGSPFAQTGLTLWAPMDPRGPMWLTGTGNVRQAMLITKTGLVPRDGVPLGIEASVDAGTARASGRFTDRYLEIGKMRATTAMAA